jgi:hypothetical protein
VTAILLLGCNKASESRRVTAYYPEHWSVGEYRNCALVGEDPASKLPHLDCDLQASDTPRNRMYVMDVEFSGDAKKRLNIDWTCQRTKETLVCRDQAG